MEIHPHQMYRMLADNFTPRCTHHFFEILGIDIFFALLIQSKRVAAQNQNITEPLCTFNLMKT